MGGAVLGTTQYPSIGVGSHQIVEIVAPVIERLDRNPLVQAVGAAAGVGLIIGLLIGRR